MSLHVVSWNMDHWKGIRKDPEHPRTSWDYLRSLDPDVALLQEAVPPPHALGARGPLSTIPSSSELEAWHLGPTRKWGTAIAFFGSTLAEVPTESDLVPEVTAHAGCFQVAKVATEEYGDVHFVSIYGIMGPTVHGVRYAITSVHRMLSDLTPLLDLSRSRAHVIMAGDLNLSTQLKPPDREAHKVAFARIRAFGLVDCLETFRDKRIPEEGCPCEESPACGHVRTQRHPRSPIPWQTDYLFASPGLADRLVSCEALNEDDRAWSLSDHCPIVAVFK